MKDYGYVISYFGGDGIGGVVAGNVELHLEKPIVIHDPEDINSLRIKMIKVKQDLRGKNFGIMGIIPLNKEL